MPKINLLPWREELKKQKNQEFITLIGLTVGLMLAAVAAVHLYMVSLIDNQNSRNSYLDQEIKAVEKKIKEIENLDKQKEQLIARMQVIEQLQQNRPAIVHLFDEIAKILPEGLYIEDLTQKGVNITIKGRAQSNARVSALMRSLEKSEWFDKPTLDVISSQKQKQGDTNERAFTLMVLQATPKEEKK